MSDWSDIRRTRRANLHSYLLADHPNEVTQEGGSLRLLNNHSVSIKTGWSGYNDFSNGETGNAVECLVRFFGYGIQEAAVRPSACLWVPAPPQPQLVTWPDLRWQVLTVFSLPQSHLQCHAVLVPTFPAGPVTASFPYLWPVRSSFCLEWLLGFAKYPGLSLVTDPLPNIRLQTSSFRPYAPVCRDVFWPTSIYFSIHDFITRRG